MAHSMNAEVSPQSSHLCGSISIPTWAAAPLPASPPALLQCDIYLSPPAFCLPSFPQLIYGCCLLAPGHRSLNLAIMCGSSQRPSICGASVRPDGLPSSSSIFPAMLAHPFGSGAAAHVLLVASVLPPHPHRSLLSWDARSHQVGLLGQSRGWGGFKEVIRVHCTGKNKIAFHPK